jgi:rod shape-determining protein MreC
MALTTPDSEPRLFSGPGAGVRLVLLATLSIVLMVLDHRNQHLVQIRSLLGAALYPLQQAVDAPMGAAEWARDNLATRATLAEENAAMRSRLLEQSGQLQRMAALEAENARMRALLDSTAKVGDDLLIAEIVSVDMDRQRHRVVINRGTTNGAELGQALIDARGVVGQVIRDRGESAEALLITDPDHATPVEVVRNGLRTIAVGTGDLERLSLPFMARNADVKPGDLLVSSGLGGKFPAGYPVATVLDVRGDSGEPFLTVTARPTAALDRVREVLLVKRRGQTAAAPLAESPGEPPAEPAKPAASPAPAGTQTASPAPARTPAASPAAGGTPAAAPTAAPQATPVTPVTPPASTPPPAASSGERTE